MIKHSRLINSILFPIALFSITLIYLNYLDVINWVISALLLLFFVLCGIFEGVIQRQVHETTSFLPKKNVLWYVILIALLGYIAANSTWMIAIPGLIYIIIITFQYLFFHYDLQNVGHVLLAFLKNYLPIMILFYAHLNFLPGTLIRFSLIFYIPQFLNTWIITYYIASNSQINDNNYNQTVINQYMFPLMNVSVVLAFILSISNTAWYSLLYLLLLPLYYFFKKSNFTKATMLYSFIISFSVLTIFIWSFSFA